MENGGEKFEAYILDEGAVVLSNVLVLVLVGDVGRDGRLSAL